MVLSKSDLNKLSKEATNQLQVSLHASIIKCFINCFLNTFEILSFIQLSFYVLKQTRGSFMRKLNQK